MRENMAVQHLAKRLVRDLSEETGHVSHTGESLKCYPDTTLNHEMFVNIINIFQYLIWSMT